MLLQLVTHKLTLEVVVVAEHNKDLLLLLIPV
jgi:hypothetical protein